MPSPNQGKITGGDRDVVAGQIDKQREALLEIQDKLKDGTPYVVRGTFVSREDSSAMPLHLLMHVVRRNEASSVAHYDLILHDTTFGEAIQHPGRAQQRFVHDPPAAVYCRLEGEALEDMADDFHAHNDYPKGTEPARANFSPGGSSVVPVEMARQPVRGLPQHPQRHQVRRRAHGREPSASSRYEQHQQGQAKLGRCASVDDRRAKPADELRATAAKELVAGA